MATQQEMEEWFKGFDADGSGKIDTKELRSLVKQFREWQGLPNDDASIDADVQVLTFTYFKFNLQLRETFS